VLAWRTLDTAGRRWHVVFESTSLAGVTAAIRACLGAGALLAADAGGAAAPGLPPLPEVELGLVRRADTEADPLVDAVEHLLRRLA
jgi:hypothetical protein